MQKVRESNFDLLRILSAFSIVLLHVSSNFLQIDEMRVPQNCHFPTMLLNSITRFAVPCFFMLSGAFILAKERNADYKYFYKKVFKNIGIPSIIFCLLYMLYRIAKLIIGVIVFKQHNFDYILPNIVYIIKQSIIGWPFDHLWYVFTLVGLYLVAPFVIKLAADLRGGVNLYGRITTVFLVLASVSYITSEHLLTWDIGWQFYFLSYFLMGYKLRQWGKMRKNNHIALLLISTGFVINVFLAYANYLRGLKGLPVDTIQYSKNPFSYMPLAPIEVIAACLIFAGFSVMNIQKDFSKLASYTFMIYLIHMGVLDIIYKLIGKMLIGNQLVETVATILLSLTIFLISLFAAVIYKKFQLKHQAKTEKYT